MLEEAYLYVDIPAPPWGIQFGLYRSGQPELVAVVREGDCVLMPKGYHPNVAAPGGAINSLWMMAANREGEDGSSESSTSNPKMLQADQTSRATQ